MPFQNTPFYDPLRTYDQNCQEGPFGPFADDQSCPNVGESQIKFLGQKISSDFGIPYNGWAKSDRGRYARIYPLTSLHYGIQT